jgi:hypothetical protein
MTSGEYVLNGTKMVRTTSRLLITINSHPLAAKLLMKTALSGERYLSPSIHKFDDVFIHSGLNAARDEPFGSELRPKGARPIARAEWSSRSKTIAKVILMKIRYGICESKHLVKRLCFLRLWLFSYERS